jgi:hypothetical protein
LLVACLLAIGSGLALNNLVLLSRDFLLGDRSAEHVLPAPRYGFARIPDDPVSRAYHAQDRLAVDFAQIYFPSRDLDGLSRNYQAGDFDPLQRQSRYPPLLAVLCSISLCRLEYGLASLLHMLIQLAVFSACLVIALRAFGIGRLLLPALLLVNAALFLTPAGLSWFERGQFSLYVAASYLLLLTGLLQGAPLLVLAAAPLAFIKWISLPYIAVAFSAVLFSANGATKRKRAMVLAAAFGAIVAALTFATPVSTPHFLRGLYDQERNAIPGGISLAKVLPLPLAKLLPVPLVALAYLHARANRGRTEALVPFLAGAAVVMQTYPTLAYDYSMPVLLGLIAPILHWSGLPDTALRRHGRRFVEYAYFFLLLTSYSNYILPQQNWMVFCVYLLVAGLFLGLPLLPSWRPSGISAAAGPATRAPPSEGGRRRHREPGRGPRR